MNNTIIIKETILFIVIGLIFGASAIPAIGNYTSSIKSIYLNPVGINDAKKVVNAKLSELQKPVFSTESFTEIKNDQGILLYYIFDLNPQGYVVVSGSDDLPPVIAYSFTNNFEVPNSPKCFDDLVVIMDSAAWTPRVRYGAQAIKQRLESGGEPPIGKVLVKVRGRG